MNHDRRHEPERGKEANSLISIIFAFSFAKPQTSRDWRSFATTGLYAYMRHPQYAGFILIMFGFLLQWPTILSLAMFPVLVVMYGLAKREEADMLIRPAQAATQDPR